MKGGQTFICLALKVLLIAHAFGSETTMVEDYPDFRVYKLKFNKEYEQKEDAIRQAIYNRKIKQIIQHNREEGHQYKMGVNNFTDWKSQQVEDYIGRGASGRNKFWNSAETKPQKIKRNLRLLQATNLNWVTMGAVTSVKNQGSCGACWAFSTVATAESEVIIQGRADNTLSLSPQYPLVCTTGSTCTGGQISDASQLMVKNGCPYSSQYAYNPNAMNTAICLATSGNLMIAKARNYYTTISSDSDLISLLQNSPVAVAISATNWQNYASGIFSCSSTAVINHAVELVGYTSTYWILKNQWAETWGQKGYIWVTRSRVNPWTNCYIGIQVMQFVGSPMSDSWVLLCLALWMCLLLIL